MKRLNGYDKTTSCSVQTTRLVRWVARGRRSSSDSRSPNQFTIAICLHQTSSIASVRSLMALLVLKTSGHSWWSNWWMSTSSCRPLYTYHSSTKACAIMQCCISSRRSREFSRRKSGAHYFSVLRCIGQLRLHWNRSLTHSPCNAKWLKSKRQRTSA